MLDYRLLQYIPSFKTIRDNSEIPFRKFPKSKIYT